MSEMTCDRCGARLDPAITGCPICVGVEYTLDQAHTLLDRILMHWMYGDGKLGQLQMDTEVWCRVAGPPR